MDPLEFLSIFLLFFLQTPTNAQTCTSIDCGYVTVDFPFRLSEQPDCCGNPNFNLSCRSANIGQYFQPQTIVTFPFSGEFRIDLIHYSTQSLRISDQKACTPERLIQGFDLSGTPFKPRYSGSYLFFNCSQDVSQLLGNYATPIPCLRGVDFSVLAIPTILYNQSSPLRSCVKLATVSVPLESPDIAQYLPDSLLLTWEEPDCSSSCNNCENTGREKKKNKGISNGSHYVLIFGLGTPTLFFVVFVVYCNASANHGDHPRRQHPIAQFFRLDGLHLAAAAAKGLDKSRIESYPITLLGESFQLARPNDNTCSICLSEYEAKETIRTITDCGHYFHSNCIDEWLKVNATCPVCRNTPDEETALIAHSRLSSSSPS